MPRTLSSKVYSTETLIAGLTLVKSEEGMDDLSGMSTAEMESELARLEERAPYEC